MIITFMRMLFGSFFCVFLITCQASPFVNLGFDEARTNEANITYSDSGVPYGDGPMDVLLPGWTLSFDGKTVTNIMFNTSVGSFYSPILYDQHYIDIYGGLPPEGKFALFLRWPAGIAYELSQVGEIPIGARFLSYRSMDGPFEVWIDDERLPPLPPGNYQGIGGIADLVFDVARFAGKTVKLGFKPAAGYSGVLDSIQFVTELPTLSIQRSGNNLVLTWPNNVKHFGVEEADSLKQGGSWQPGSNFLDYQIGDPNRATVRIDQADRCYPSSWSGSGLELIGQLHCRLRIVTEMIAYL